MSLVQDSSHETATAFMQMTDVLDCLIPRGGPSLIAAMREHARVPYVLDGDGNCHVFVDAVGRPRGGRRHRAQREDLATRACATPPRPCSCTRRSPRRSCRRWRRRCPRWNCAPTSARRRYLPDATPASEEDFEREFLDLILAVKVVDSLDEAIAHVARYGTGHSEAILTNDHANAEAWVKRVDAAAVVVNASTRFVDGGELGLGGEVGISTQKLHARGPMGLRELTCLKWVVRGEGQIR